MMDYWELVLPSRRDELKAILDERSLDIGDLLRFDLWSVITPQTRDDLKVLMAEQNVELAEFINTSMTMMKWAITSIKERRVVGAIDEANSKWRELQIPMLDKYRTSS